MPELENAESEIKDVQIGRQKLMAKDEVTRLPSGGLSFYTSYIAHNGSYYFIQLNLYDENPNNSDFIKAYRDIVDSVYFFE